MAASGAATSTAASDSFSPSELSETVAYPATNSSESPGRKNPSSSPVSAKRIRMTPATPSTSSRCCAEREPRTDASTCTIAQASGWAYFDQSLQRLRSGQDADREPRGLRRDARPGEGRRLRLSGHQLHLVADRQRRAARVRRGGER